MNIEIRKYNENDLEGVNKILKQAFSVEKNNFNNTLCCEVVACSDKEVCGYLCQKCCSDAVMQLDFRSLHTSKNGLYYIYYNIY